MNIKLPTITIAELHKQLQAYLDQGLGDTPVAATDCRARYPFQAYTVLSPSGYTDALLLYVRPDAHFAQRDPLPLNWGPSRVAEWNAEADLVKGTCGAFHGIAGTKPAEVQEALSHLADVAEARARQGEDCVPERLRNLTDADVADAIQRARSDVLLAARIIERQAKALEAVKERLRVDDPHDLYDAVCDALMPIAGTSST